MATVTESAAQSRALIVPGLASVRNRRSRPCWSIREKLGSCGAPGAGNTRVRADSESTTLASCAAGARSVIAFSTCRAEGQASSGPGATSTDTARKVRRAKDGCTNHSLYYRSGRNRSPVIGLRENLFPPSDFFDEIGAAVARIGQVRIPAAWRAEHQFDLARVACGDRATNHPGPYGNGLAAHGTDESRRGCHQPDRLPRQRGRGPPQNYSRAHLPMNEKSPAEDGQDLQPGSSKSRVRSRCYLSAMARASALASALASSGMRMP